MDDPLPPRRAPPSGPKWRHLVALAAASLFLMWFAARSPFQGEKAPNFNVDMVPKGPEQPPDTYVSLAEREFAQREGPRPAGLVPEKGAVFSEDPKQEAEAKPVLSVVGAPKFDAMIRAEQRKLLKITRRYYQNEPVVRDVDKAFGSLPRYMAVKEKYQHDRDAYAFAHDALALPEVRKTVYKYALDPTVWRVTLSMMGEALKEKPPKPLYDEMKRFFTQDRQVVGFASELSAYMAPRMGALLPQVLKPGQDMTPLKDLAKDLNIGKNGVAPPPASAGGPPPQKKQGDSHKGEKIDGTDVPALPDSELKIGDTDGQKNQQINDLGKGSRPHRER